MQGTDGGRKTQYQQDIEYIRANDITNGNGRLALASRNDAGSQFGQRRTAGHHRQTYHTLADVQRISHAGGGVDKQVAAQHQSQQTAQQIDYVLPDGRRLCLHLRRAARLGLHQRVNHEDGEACKQDDAVHTSEETVKCQQYQQYRGHD